MNRRRFLQASGLIGLSGLANLPAVAQEKTITLPFEKGERPLVAYPGKRLLILHTSRPPQLETPFSVFDEGVLTPNDAFFVRYHLAGLPPASIDLQTFRLEIKGKVNQPAEFSIADLKSKFQQTEVIAVNQCSGNSRGFFQPRVPGGQLGNGAMGNARWRGVRLKDVLKSCGVTAGALQVTFNGLDKPIMPTTPDFVKALDIDHAMDGEVLLAFQMNGEDLPWLNGFPLRLVVPGYYGTYWIKHLNEITVVDQPFTGFWMSTAYRIPNNPTASVEPGTVPAKTVPISKLNVRSFITSHANGAQLRSGEGFSFRGIAFDGGYGIDKVLFSPDGGENWRETVLGRDHGKYSFREWAIPFLPNHTGQYSLKVKAINRTGQTQPAEALWNPAGYMRNVIETVNITAT